MSRIRSPVTSRSNWANDSSTLRVKPPHRGGRVELLSDRDERHALGVEDLDDLGEVGQRAGQPVDLVDDDDVDLPRRMSASSRCRAGRSMLPPESPPSS